MEERVDSSMLFWYNVIYTHKRIKLDSCLVHIIYRNYLKIEHISKYKSSMYKPLEDSIDVNVHDLGFGNSSYYDNQSKSSNNNK